MSNKKQLRKMIKREKAIALSEKAHPTKQRKHRSPEAELFAEIDGKVKHNSDGE